VPAGRDEVAGMRHGYNSEKLQSVVGSDGRNPMKIYLDTSVYNRPFDDQTQVKIFLETKPVSLSSI
jgi:hypothetical protein